MNDAEPQPPSKTLIRIACVAAWIVGVLLCCRGEIDRFANRPQDQPVWVAAVTNLDIDTSLFVPLLALAPLAWFSVFRSGSGGPPADRRAPIGLAILVSLGVGLVGFAAAREVAQTDVSGVKTDFGQLPPAYHDEYSYLFQAKTFLAGRTSFPGEGPVGLFDQMHVLNGDRFASRYFPATGMWLAPFVAADRPYLGHHLANALIAALLCFAGCRIAGLAAGVIAGLLVALAPGMAIFSNLLLAHQPALVGLSVFLVAFLEARRRRPMAWGLLAGCGLTFAMLGRPMTAAGFALPFGLWLAWSLVRGTERAPRLRMSVGLGVPLLCGFLALAAYNRSITGDFLTTPYSVYTNQYSPNHVYGFNNVERGEQVTAPKRIEKYDRWAKNLTPAVAMANVKNRLAASFQWTLGLIPNAMLAVLCVLMWPRLRFEAKLILASIVSLHIAHVPYWFDGIMHYHYVFETGVLWCLLGGIVVVDLWRSLDLRLASLPTAWVCACVVATFSTAWLHLSNPFVADTALVPRCRIQQEVDGVSFSRLKYARFRERVKNLKQPALVLVEHDPADIHIEFVNNPPSLDADILTGHAEAFENPAEAMSHFPDRTIYIYSVVEDTISQLPR